MVRSILRFFAASISFVVLLFTTNPAIATTSLDSSAQQVSTPAVNLSVSSLSISSFDINSIQNQNHLGCACADCTGNLAQGK